MGWCIYKILAANKKKSSTCSGGSGFSLSLSAIVMSTSVENCDMMAFADVVFYTHCTKRVCMCKYIEIVITFGYMSSTAIVCDLSVCLCVCVCVCVCVCDD